MTDRELHFEPTERDESRDFGNEQTISVHDKEHAALGPTEEAQDVDRLARQIVPMPAFNDPNNPVAASGSVNLSLNDHPVKHSPDYGVDVADALGFHPVEGTMEDGARTLHEFDMTSDDDSPETEAAKRSAAGNPENREEWTKAHWQNQAKALGLATSGNVGTVKGRVEDFEAEQEERTAFEKEVRGTNREALDKQAAKLDINPEEYSTKELLAEAVIAAEYGEEVPAGDKSSESEQ